MILIGNIESKRTIYFKKAAQYLGISVQMLPYCDGIDFFLKTKELLAAQIEEKRENKIPQFCKIDPPSYEFLGRKQYQIDSMYEVCKKYNSWLSALPAPSETFHYLNTPKSLALLLDKYQCKQKLISKGLEVTPLLGKNIETYQELKQKMRDWHCNAVFIKPCLASGAAGILAYRCHPSNGQEVLYTSVCLQVLEGREIAINTKKMFCYRESEWIEKICRHILPLGTIVERWIPKPAYKHCKYDLRVLYQFGKIAFITVRQSKGPITNLHLNNHPLPTKQPGILPECLELTKKQISDMEQLCEQAVSAFEGLSMAGIDILFEKNSKKPMIIEMNGQGDLLYQDIYNENKIYSEQAAVIAEQERCL